MKDILKFNKLSSKLCYLLFIFNFFNISLSGRTMVDLSKITTSDMIRNEGYVAEEHEITTEDGYILTVYRIPGVPASIPVFVQHGFLSSSFDWVVTGKNKGLAFVLANEGYDVWLGNARGTIESRRHVRLDPSDPQFWNFSFHEMGIYDLPAIITYITDLKNTSLIYVGHSMGTTMSYVMATKRLDMTDRVRVIFSFAPIAFMRRWTSPTRILSVFVNEVQAIMKQLKIYELFPPNFRKSISENPLCQAPTIMNPCTQIMFFISGYNPTQYNYTLSPLIGSHLPADSSVKALFHLLQMGKIGRFQHYDYGPTANKEIYNSLEPPKYDLSKIQIPIGIFWSDNDLFCHPSDVQAFYKAIPKKALNYRVRSPLFSHTDFMWAIDAVSLVYSKLLSAMKDYS